MSDRRTIHRFLLLRMAVAALVVGAGALIIQVTSEGFPVSPLYVTLVVIAATGGIGAAAMHAGAPARAVVWGLIGADLLVEAVLVHYSGGVSSQFSLVYALTIVAAAFLEAMPGGMATAAAASACYVLYGTAESAGWIVPPARDQLVVPPHRFGVLDVYMHVALFFLVGTVGGYLSRRIRDKGRALESAENELKQLRVDTDYILNNMSSGIVVVDTNRRVITINPAACEILSLRRDDVLTRPLEAVLGDGAASLRRELLDALATGRDVHRHEVTVESADGRRVPLGLSTSIMRDAGGRLRGVIAVFQDLTEVKEMRERVRRADRLAAVGELSAGIAHELRNPLASISGSIELLAGELELEGEHRRLMELILRESDRLDRIISEFLDFARLRHPSRRPVDLGACLEEVLVLLRNNARAEGVDVVLERRGEVGPVRVDDEQMRQVFTNLAVNACEAMEGRGRLEVTLEADGDDGVRIVFRDTGPGVVAPQRERLFEPFFTTKEGGTGLGLAIAGRIVAAHGGTIDVRNVDGGGAEFVIRLPVGRIETVRDTGTVAAGVGAGVDA